MLLYQQGEGKRHFLGHQESEENETVESFNTHTSAINSTHRGNLQTVPGTKQLKNFPQLFFKPTVVETMGLGEG